MLRLWTFYRYADILSSQTNRLLIYGTLVRTAYWFADILLNPCSVQCMILKVG